LKYQELACRVLLGPWKRSISNIIRVHARQLGGAKSAEQQLKKSGDVYQGMNGTVVLE
jgi:hypothetical protein